MSEFVPYIFTIAFETTIPCDLDPSAWKWVYNFSKKSNEYLTEPGIIILYNYTGNYNAAHYCSNIFYNTGQWDTSNP